MQFKLVEAGEPQHTDVRRNPGLFEADQGDDYLTQD